MTTTTTTTTTTDERIAKWTNEIRVIDGGIGSELERRLKYKLQGKYAYFFRYLKEDPNLVCEIHKRAGCDVVCTNTYQASPQSICNLLNVSYAESVELMHHAVRLVRRAIDSELDQCSTFKRKLPILIAGSLGSYGVCGLIQQQQQQQETTDFTNNISFEDLVRFHYERAKILVDCGVDLIAWQSIPLMAEVIAICTAIKYLPTTLCWISLASKNAKKTICGDSLREIAFEVEKYEQVIGIGIDCTTSLDLMSQSLTNLQNVRDTCAPGNEDGFHPPPCSLRKQFGTCTCLCSNGIPKLLIACPDKSKSHKSWIDLIKPWSKRREVVDPRPLGNDSERQMAQWVGGCCHVNPDDIGQLARWMKSDEFGRQSVGTKKRRKRRRARQCQTRKKKQRRVS